MIQELRTSTYPKSLFKYLLLTFLSLLVWDMAAAQNTEGLVVGSRVNIRNAPNLSGKVLGQTSRWEVVPVLRATDTWYELKQGKMIEGAGYAWFEIRISDGTTGWIFGKFLAAVIAPTLLDPYGNSAKVKIKDKTFRLHHAAVHWYDPEEDGKGPYSDVWESHYFFRDETGKVYPLFQSDLNEALVFQSGSGSGGETLEGMWKPQEFGDVLLYFDFGYQEGQEKKFYYLSYKAGQFSVSKTIETGLYYGFPR